MEQLLYNINQLLEAAPLEAALLSAFYSPPLYIVLWESALCAVMYATNYVLLLQLWDVNPLRTFQQSSPDP